MSENHVYMFFFPFLFHRSLCLTSADEWCNGCDALQPVSKIPIYKLIPDVLSGTQACDVILPPRSWTRSMQLFFKASGHEPYRAADAQAIVGKGQIGGATFYCESLDRSWTGFLWSIGPYLLKCPSEYWRVIIREERSQTFRPIEPPAIQNSLVCVSKEYTLPQNILPMEGDCLDVLLGKGTPVLLIAWSTKDDGIVGSEVVAAFFTFTEGGGNVDPREPVRTRRMDDRTAFYVYKSRTLGSRLTFCYRSAQKFATVFRTAPVYAW